MLSNSPRNFSMTLGTARGIVAKPDGYKPHIVAEARRVVAYWNVCDCMDIGSIEELANIGGAPALVVHCADLRDELAAALQAMVARFGNHYSDQDEQPKTFGCHHNAETCSLCDGLVSGWKAVRAARAALAKIKPRQG